MSKACNKCNEVKALELFPKDSRNKDGRGGTCASCKDEAKAANRAKLIATKSYRIVTEKCCNKCNGLKPSTEFYKDKAMGDGLSSICKTCKSESVAAWREANRDKYNADQRAYMKNMDPQKRYGAEIKRRYGCTLEDYNKKLIEQEGKCALCGALHNPAEKKGRLYVDHCHSTGKVRDLLCKHCNSGLGYFDDKPDLLQKAIEYLKKHQ